MLFPSNQSSDVARVLEKDQCAHAGHGEQLPSWLVHQDDADRDEPDGDDRPERRLAGHLGHDPPDADGEGREDRLDHQQCPRAGRHTFAAPEAAEHREHVADHGGGGAPVGGGSAVDGEAEPRRKGALAGVEQVDPDPLAPTECAVTFDAPGFPEPNVEMSIPFARATRIALGKVPST